MLKDISEMDRKVGNDVRESYTMKTFEKGGGVSKRVLLLYNKKICHRPQNYLLYDDIEKPVSFSVSSSVSCQELRV